MADRSLPQAESAYRRAVSAYDNGSPNEAQRWAREALAIDPAHAAAAALLRRLGGREAGPQVVSTDPTVLIDRGDDPTMAASADPTIVVPRRAPRPAPSKRDPAPPGPPHRSPPRRHSEPTVIVSPSNGGRRPSRYESVDRTTGLSWRPWKGRGRRDGFPAGISTPGGRGILIVVGVMALVALSAWGIVEVIPWFSSDAPLLTVKPAEGGRIVGDGIRCGDGSSSCSTSVPKGERVELAPEPASGYEFVGFTGDCEEGRGVLLMDAAKTCGARFEKRSVPPPSPTYTLTIEKPKGGSILYQEVITCGSLGSDCSEDVKADERVTLRRQADEGYVFESFSPGCDGEFVMNAARTCAAVFLATSTPGVNKPPRTPDDFRGPGPRTGPRPQPTAPSASGNAGSGSSPEPVPLGPPSAPIGPVAPPALPPAAVSPSPATAPPQAPPKAPDTPEEHAKKEIKQRIGEYCKALETLKPDEVQKVFPRQDARALKRQFQNYKSLKCALTSELEYTLLDVGSAADGAASARVKVGVKQTQEMQSGGAPKAQETTVTFTLSRRDQRSPWIIVDMEAEVKK